MFSKHSFKMGPSRSWERNATQGLFAFKIFKILLYFEPKIVPIKKSMKGKSSFINRNITLYYSGK